MMWYLQPLGGRMHRFVLARAETKVAACIQHIFVYRKIASSNISRLEAHADFFRLLMKGIFDPYVL